MHSPTARPSTIAAAVLLTVGTALGGSWLVLDTGQASAAVEAPDAEGADIESGDELAYSTVRPQRADLSIDHEATGGVAAVATQVVSSPIAGTVVEVIEPGSNVEPGAVLAVIDDHPITVISGSIPMWRSLSIGDEGADVAQLESALVALGFDPDAYVTVDEEYTSATAAMVADWQESIGADDTGSVGRYDIVVLDAAMTVASVAASIGASVNEGDGLITLESEEQIVTASIPLADAVTLQTGDAVELMLPDRTLLSGEVRSLTLGTDASVRIAEIEFTRSDVAEAEEAGESDADSVAESSTRAFAGMTVEVSWTESVATDVLTVPADTFRHLDDGSYVLDLLADDGTVTPLTVEPGRHVGNLVEVTGLPADADVIQP